MGEVDPRQACEGAPPTIRMRPRRRTRFPPHRSRCAFQDLWLRSLRSDGYSLPVGSGRPGIKASWLAAGSLRSSIQPRTIASTRVQEPLIVGPRHDDGRLTAGSADLLDPVPRRLRVVGGPQAMVGGSTR